MSLRVLLLLGAVLGLVVGPLLLRVRTDTRHYRAALDGFALVAVGGLAVLHLLPEAIAHGGLIAAAFALGGAFLPGLVERNASRTGTSVAAAILLLGLLPHVALESAALGSGSANQVMGLGIAVAAHRLPVGLILFSMIGQRHGARPAWAAIGVLIVATIGGFVAGDALAGALTGEPFAWLQGLVGGSLLHVTFSRRLPEGTLDTMIRTLDPDEDTQSGGDHIHTHATTPATAWPAVGAIIGAMVVILALVWAAGHTHAAGEAGFVSTFMDLARVSAAPLLFAYVLAGLMRTVIPPAGARWLDNSRGIAGAMRGAVFGLPQPVPSCGVLSMYQRLIDRGVPTAAAMGFLIATPLLGLEALLLSVPLLGVELTLARLGTAFVVALIVAVMIGQLVGDPATDTLPDASTTSRDLTQRLRAGLRFGLIERFDHTMPWVLAGLLIAATVEPLLDPTLLGQIPSLLQVPALALIGIPFFVCAAGATPLAAVAIHHGISPGAALAFLVAGPAANLATLGILQRLHTRRIATVFGIGVTLVAVGLGLAVDLVAVDALGGLQPPTHSGGTWPQWLCLITLAGLVLASLFRQGPRGMVGQIIQPIQAP